MKKLLVVALGTLCATAILAQAQDPKPAKRHLTPKQQAVMKEMLAKYDANQDGKLEKDERANITKADKEKMIKAGLLKHRKNNQTEASANAPAGGK